MAVGVDYLNGVNVGAGMAPDPFGVGMPRMMGDISLSSPVAAVGGGGGGGGGGFAMSMMM